MDIRLPPPTQSLVGLSTDLASFYNTDPGEAMEALAAGLRGESEPLRFLPDGGEIQEEPHQRKQQTDAEENGAEKNRLIVRGLHGKAEQS